MKLNHHQRLALWAGAGWVCLCLAFPPWVHVYDAGSEGRFTRPAGHAPLFAPPEKVLPGLRVDYGRALMCATIGVVLSGAAVLTLRPSSHRE